MAATTATAAARLPVRGPVRSGRRTKHLVKRLQPGEVALIDHADLDRVSAEDLIGAGAAAVLNCRPSSSADYPNMGPELLADAGIPLVDLPDDSLFDSCRDGDGLEVRGGEVWRGSELLVTGELLDPVVIRRETDRRRREIGGALEAFARNTVEHMVEEQDLLSGRIDLPPLRTDFRDRPALIVVRGVSHQADLQALRSYIRDQDPVIVAVDGGADAVLDAGYEVDMLVGDMDSASERALTSGAELVVHAYSDGEAPGSGLLEQLGLDYVLMPAPGTSQDVAMLIAAERGASLIVAVGSQFNLVEFLDKRRQGMSSTFLTRLRLGERIVDAKGVSKLYRPSPTLAPILAVLGVGVLAFAAVVIATPALRGVAELLWVKLKLLLGGSI
ncbi:MAG: hypothetical protein FGM34_03580 [Solirubrobacteraceae bacterium]|nr:hypothetical protein [Solirubrobacteraceae bacterium]